MASVPAVVEHPLDIAAAIRRAAALLDATSPTSRLDAEVLLDRVCGISRQTIFAHPERALTPAETALFESAVGRRAAGEPLAYITGVREFWSLSLTVATGVLVPRPETELLVETALDELGERQTATVLDLGTGSGAVALALKSSRADLDITAVDSERNALDVARSNAQALRLDVRFVLSDWFAALGGQRFDLVVCNPPYVRSDDPHLPGLVLHEPRVALDAGPDGLDAFRAVLDTAAPHLVENGRLIFEHGYDQREALMALATERGYRVAGMREDLAGHARVLVLGHSTGAADNTGAQP